MVGNKKMSILIMLKLTQGMGREASILLYLGDDIAFGGVFIRSIETICSGSEALKKKVPNTETHIDAALKLP